MDAEAKPCERTEEKEPETRPFSFSGRVTYEDGSPVEEGTVTLRFAVVYNHYAMFPKHYPSYRSVPLCDPWTAALVDGRFEGRVALRVLNAANAPWQALRTSSPSIGVQVQGPTFIEGSARMPIGEVRDAVIAGDLRSRDGSIRMSERAAEPAFPSSALVVARERGLSVLLPGSFWNAESRSQPSGANLVFLEPRENGESWQWPHSGGAVPLSDDWKFRFSPQPRDHGFISWNDHRADRGGWTKTGWRQYGTYWHTSMYGPIPVEDRAPQVLDLRRRQTGALVGELLDTHGRRWSGPATITWQPSSEGEGMFPEPRFYEAGSYRHLGTEESFTFSDLLPGRYELVAAVASKNPHPHRLSTVARMQVEIRDGRRTEVRVSFDQAVIYARVEEWDGTPCKEWRLACYEVYREQQPQWRAWTLHWQHAEYSTTEDGIPQVLVPITQGAGDLEEERTRRTYTQFRAPPWWQDTPGYHPSLWLATSGFDPLEGDHEGAYFLAETLPTGQPYVLRATAGDRTVARYFESGVPEDVLVFRFPPR